MADSITKRAFKLYKAPFRFLGGYIWDDDGEMVADNRADPDTKVVGNDPALRVRGWGRMSYLPNPEELQNEVGRLMAEALTDYWRKNR